MSVSALQGWRATKEKAEKELLSKRKRKRWQECCGYCENCITIELCITRFRCTCFSRLKVPGKPDAKSLGTNSKGTIQLVYATSNEYPGKERTIAWKITSQKSSQRTPCAMKFEDRSHEETERQQRCARGKAWDLAKNTNSKKKKRLHSVLPRRNGYSRLRQQKSRSSSLGETLWGSWVYIPRRHLHHRSQYRRTEKTEILKIQY